MNQEDSPIMLKFQQLLEHASLRGHLNIYKDLLNDKLLPEISKELKEEKIYQEVIICSTVLGPIFEEFLSYLIFDYKIDQKYFDNFNPRIDGSKKAQEMFEVRKAREELSSELNQELSTNEKQIKKPKV